MKTSPIIIKKPKKHGRTQIAPELTKEREDRAWKLRVEGRSQQYIANDLGISQSGVSLILDRLHNRYREELDKDVKRFNDKHIAQLENIFAEAIEAWNIDVKANNARDATYLNTAMSALESVRKIVIGKQKEDDFTNSVGQDPLERILGILDTARTRRDSQINS